MSTETIEFRDGHTYVYDEDGNIMFVLLGQVMKERVHEIVVIRQAAYEQGQHVGRTLLALELRRLLGAAGENET